MYSVMIRYIISVMSRQNTLQTGSIEGEIGTEIQFYFVFVRYLPIDIQPLSLSRESGVNFPNIQHNLSIDCISCGRFKEGGSELNQEIELILQCVCRIQKRDPVLFMRVIIDLILDAENLHIM